MSKHDMAPFPPTKHTPRSKVGSVEYHTEPSAAAKAILGSGRGVGDTGASKSNNRTNNGGKGATKGNQRSAGNINTGC